MTLILAGVHSAHTGFEVFWFIIIAILWSGYFVLEGFDFGVGIMLGVVARDDLDRRVLINTIGPVWDGNEVWLLVAGGATFAAFPNWYATLFSGFYLPLFLILAALIFRGVAFEFRSKTRLSRLAPRLGPCDLLGQPAAGGLVGSGLRQHLPRRAHRRELHLSRIVLQPPQSLLAARRGHDTDPVQPPRCGLHVLEDHRRAEERASRAARVLAPAATAAIVAFLAWTYVNAHNAHDTGLVPPFVPILAIAAIAVVGWLLREHLEGWAFVATAAGLVFLVATIFLNLYPRVMVSSISPAYDLTIGNSASAPYTLKVMTIVALIFTPLVLVYQGWSYWVFRGRLSRPAQPTPTAPAPGAPGPAPGEAGSVAPVAGAAIEESHLGESGTS